MKLRKSVYQFLNPIARYYSLFVVLAILQAIATIALPIIYPDFDPVYWLIMLGGCGSWLTTYILLKQIHYADESKKGFRARLRHAWENIVFIIWLATSALLAIGIVKLALFLFFN